MGKTQDLIGGNVYRHHHHHLSFRSKGIPPKTPCMHNNPRNKLVWVPAIPSWEKEFIYEVGTFTWKRFLELKEYVYPSSNVMDWDDSAAKEVFDSAKNRFYAKTKGLALPDSPTAMDPNLYIDEVNSYDDEEVDPELYRDLDSAKFVENLEDGEENVIYSWDIIIEDIKPTGWDVVDLDDYGRRKDPTGLIVGY